MGPFPPVESTERLVRGAFKQGRGGLAVIK